MLKVGDNVICTWGSMKGREFVVKAVLNNGDYSCKIADGSNDKYYQYSNSTLSKLNK